MPKKQITKRSATCFNCGRNFELNESDDGKVKRMWGQCPIKACAAMYDIRIVLKKD